VELKLVMAKPEDQFPAENSILKTPVRNIAMFML